MEIRETPWLTPESVSLLENIIESNPDIKILEFGCGGSTVWMSRKLKPNGCSLVSIEHDAKKHKAVKKKVSGNVEMRLKKTPYAVCSEFSDECFDVVLVDGEHNILNTAHAMRVVKPGGFLFLANADIAEHAPIKTVLLKEWEYKRNANYLQANAEVPPTTDIWRKPLTKNVADVADETLVTHAETHIHAGNYEQAEILARLSIERSANIANAFNTLAIISSINNQPTDAFRLLEAGWILEPNNLNVGKNLARILVKLERGEEALRVYNELLRTYTDDEDIIKGVAELEATLASRPAAVQVVSAEPAQPTQREVIEENMESRFFDNSQKATPEWLSQMAMRINQSEGDQQKLIDIAGELAERGHEDTAEELARTIIRDNPNFAEAYNLLGIVYFSRDRHADALRYFETAYRIEPSNPDFGKNLVGLRVHFAQYEEAIETCQAMITSCPGDQELVQIIGELLETISDKAFNGMDMSQYSDAAEMETPAAAPMHIVSAKQTSKPKLKYSFGMMVSNADESIESALKSIYDFAHEIIIVEGPVGDSTSKASGDKAINMIQEFPDPGKKLSVVRGRWADKTEQSNAYMKMATGDYVWEINPNESYNHEDLINLDEILADNQDCVDMVSFTSLSNQQEKSEPLSRIFKREADCFFSAMAPARVEYSNSTKERGHLEADTLAEDFSIYMQMNSQPKTKKLNKKQLAKL